MNPFNFGKSLKGFLSKKNFNFRRADVNLYNFHPQLVVLFAINGIFIKNKNSYLRLIWPIYCTIIVFITLALQLMFFYGGVTTGDYGFATECFCYVALLISVPVVNIASFLNTNKICELVEDMNRSFVFVCNFGTKYRDTFLAGQLRIWKFCCAWLSFCYALGFLYVLSPIILLTYQTLFETQSEHVTRPLPFAAWFPNLDPYSTPYYEILFFIESSATYIFVQTFDVYVYIQFHVLLHYYYILDMIILAFDTLFDDLDMSVVSLHRNHPRRQQVQGVLNGRIKRIVKWHISVFKAVQCLSSVYRGPLLFQLTFSSLMICLLAYQFAEKLGNNAYDIFLALLGIAISTQLWISCYLGTKLRNKAFEAGDACWNCGWHVNPLGRLVRQDIIIFIMRAQQPITIKFTGVPGLQLETFTSVMTSAYSYFNMLRQHTHAGE